MKKVLVLEVLILLWLSFSIKASADTQTEISKANKAGNIVILVVTEGKTGLETAKSIAQKASKSYAKSKVITMDKNDKANSDLVTKYRLQGAPMPLMVVVCKNGYIAGGAPAEQVKAEDLIKMIPSAKEEDLIKALNTGKSAFVVFTKQSGSKNQKQMDACQSACKSMGDKAITINVNADDKNEKSFIEKFNIEKNASYPVTMVINAQGQVASMLNGITESKDLVSAASKKVSSGCGTGSSGCGPGSSGCGPKK